MSIPNTQLDTWTNQGAIKSSSTTYQSIKNALTHSASPVVEMISSGKIRIDLQGSYAHDTNIYGDSDVDIIVHYKDTFHSNKTSLPIDQYNLHEQHYTTATYSWQDLRRDVISALTKYYGLVNIDTSGKKSLKVLPSNGRLRADVVPVISYRKYDYFYGPESNQHDREDGVALYNTITNEVIINYPDQHYKNAVSKQSITNNQYKSIVRIFKNMRSYLVDKKRLTKDDAPSYFLQGMIYNVPKELFVADKATATLTILRWLNRANPDLFMSQNGQHLLLGTSGEYWNPVAARKTITELCYLWDNWGKI
ncbi:MAG: nucleotidyltransferase [Candidatus Pacebacteria bacterium]|nr:nucleotidyltransferase [Candidatus Paceibacterota bacterium]